MRLHQVIDFKLKDAWHTKLVNFDKLNNGSQNAIFPVGAGKTSQQYPCSVAGSRPFFSSTVLRFVGNLIQFGRKRRRQGLYEVDDERG